MEQMDSEIQQRVWQRVAGSGPDFHSMELRCRESAAAFYQMARNAKPEIREPLLRLHREAHSDADTLLGMRILSGEEPDPKQNYTAADVTRNRGLAQALHRSRRAFEAYSAQAGKGEFGPVFAVMAREESRRMCEILRLIGAIQ